MGLSIFSFDLAALINSLSQITGTTEEEIISDIIELSETPAMNASEILPEAIFSDEKLIQEILLATTVTSALIQTPSPDEIKENKVVKETKPAPVSTTANPVDEEYKKAIEELIRSLQTSVTYSYKSTDIINEKVSLNEISGLSRKNNDSDREKPAETLREDNKRRELNLEKLRDELKKARLKTNAGLTA